MSVYYITFNYHLCYLYNPMEMYFCQIEYFNVAGETSVLTKACSC